MKEVTKSNKDDTMINLNENVDLNYWCEELNLRSEELMDIIHQVGPEIHDVRLHLAKRLLNNWSSAY